MHSLLAALFTLVFSFSHAASLRHSEAVDFAAAAPAHYRLGYTPTRHELLRAEFNAASYAETACVSCRRINAVYKLR